MFVLLVTLAALIDLVGAIILQNVRSAVPPFFLAGLLLAQFGLLSVWAVLGPQRLLIRWSLALLVVWFLYGCFSFGLIIGARFLGNDLEPVLRFAAMLPTLFICVQLPLWGLKAIIGGSANPELLTRQQATNVGSMPINHDPSDNDGRGDLGHVFMEEDRSGYQ